MGKEKVTVGNMQKHASSLVWGSLKDVFSRKIKDEKIEGKMLRSMCTLGELEPKMSSQLPKTQDIHYKPKRPI